MSVRLNKFLSAIGYCSRRKADELTKEGRVYINSLKANMGDKLNSGDKLYIDKKFIARYEDALAVKPVILALNKPRGIVCKTGNKDKALNIVDYVNYETRVYPVGRLDKDSEGLILLSNRGDMVNALMKASSYHEKEYEVEVDRKINKDFLDKMSKGVYIKDLDIKTRKCRVEKISENGFLITLTQGLNRQIRRMCSCLGYEVIKLRRIRIMDIRLKGIKCGEYRRLSEKEVKKLYKDLNIDI